MTKESVYAEVSKIRTGGRGSSWCREKKESECTDPEITYGFCKWDTDEDRCRKNKDQIAAYESELKQTQERMEEESESPFQKPEFMRELTAGLDDREQRINFQNKYKEKRSKGLGVLGQYLNILGDEAPSPASTDEQIEREAALDAYERRIAVFLASASNQRLRRKRSVL